MIFCSFLEDLLELFFKLPDFEGEIMRRVIFIDKTIDWGFEGN